MRGLPDFGAPVDAAVWGAFDEPGVLVGVPSALELAVDAGGHPDLLLERFRGADPGRPPAGYGLVSVGVRTRYPDAVGDRPVTRRAVPHRGSLSVTLQRLDADPGAAIALPDEPLAWDGALTGRWSARVNPETVSFLIELLGDEALPLQARADFVVRGVAARTPARAAVDLAALWRALDAALPGTEDPGAADTLVVKRSRVARWALDQLATPTPALTVEASDSPTDLPALAEVLADWILAHAGDHDAASGTRVWDLATPLPTMRPITVVQDLRGQLAALDPARHAPPGMTVPALDLGWLDVDVLVNLPPHRVGVLAVGVDLLAPPRPPARHQAATAGATLTARDTLVLRLAPGEKPAYTSQAWLVTSTPAGVSQVFGPVTPRTGRRLLLGPDDFGVRLVPVAAEPALTRLAEAAVTLVADGVEVGTTTLDAAASEAVFVADSEATAVLRTTLRDAAGREIALPDSPAEPTRLALAAVPGWGAHEVAVTATDGALEAAGGLLAVELRSADEAWLGLVTLTPDRPAGSWRYVAADPFRPGYLHRLRDVGEPGEWRGPEPVGAPLVVGGAP